MLRFQKRLAEEYHYEPIGYNLFLGDIRKKYANALPPWCNVDGERKTVYTHNGFALAIAYCRIVIGDYGAFLEIADSDIIKSAIKIKQGQEYRISDERFKDRVKYIWYTDKNNDGVKIYHQLRFVDYADYKPGMWYISPYECSVGESGDG